MPDPVRTQPTSSPRNFFAAPHRGNDSKYPPTPCLPINAFQDCQAFRASNPRRRFPAQNE